MQLIYKNCRDGVGLDVLVGMTRLKWVVIGKCWSSEVPC